MFSSAPGQREATFESTACNIVSTSILFPATKINIESPNNMQKVLTVPHAVLSINLFYFKHTGLIRWREHLNLLNVIVSMECQGNMMFFWKQYYIVSENIFHYL